jgi:hypothetical protein
MRVTTLQQNSITRYLVTPTLILWMVGFLCLFCCIEKRENPTNSSHSCCQPQNNDTSCDVKTSSPSHNEGKSKRCCLVTSNPARLTDNTSYFIHYTLAVLPPRWGMDRLAPFSIKKDTFYSRLPLNQAETYLRCCVFLI